IREIALGDVAHSLDRIEVAFEQLADDLANGDALIRQADMDRTAIDIGAFVANKTGLDQLLQIVGDVRAEIMAARAQLAGGQFLVADVEEKQRLDAVDFALAAAIKLVLDYIQKLAVQTLHQTQTLEITRAKLLRLFGFHSKFDFTQHLIPLFS